MSFFDDIRKDVAGALDLYRDVKSTEAKLQVELAQARQLPTPAPASPTKTATDMLVPFSNLELAAMALAAFLIIKAVS